MSNRIVCIVGRPNVGKSTLFNKIAGQRIAITEDTPGVTRDRIYAEAEWLGNNFTVIDTGGLDPSSADEFMKNIRAQADIAIDTADVILFLVDGVSGATSTDLEIARMLYKSQKKVLLVVNKLDTKGVKDTLHEYYELGFGEPIMVSAENGLGIGDLLDEVVAHFDENNFDEEEEDRIKVAFIGKPNAGKSSLINKIIGEDRSIVTDIPGTTRDSIDSNFEYNDHKYTFVDTAGLRKRGKINEAVERYSVVRTLAAIDRSDVCVGVIDATEGVTEQDSKIIGYAHDAGKAMIIAVNKWDLIEKDNNTIRKFEEDIRIELGFALYAPIIFISAVTGQRLNNLLDLISTVNENYNMRISTGVLNDIINKAVLMNQAPSDKGRQGKIYYASQVSVRPPKFVIFVNDKSLIHFSYVRYLENQIRQNFGFDGTPIQLMLRERNENDN